MHGKITYFNNNNGSGTIVDKNKRVFEFRKNSWHDLSTLPSKGILAEFRLDDDGKVTDCRASKFQDFEPGSYVSEADFWNTDTDAIMQELEDKRREERVNNAAKELELEELNAVQESRPVEHCINMHFIHQSRIINKYKQFIETDKKIKTLDYLKLKRFVEKAIAQLTYLDKRISEDEFHQTKIELAELEYSYTNFLKTSDENPMDLYSDIYLNRQIHFLAVQKRTIMEEEKAFALSNKIKKLQSEYRMLENRVGQVGGGKTEQGQKMAEKFQKVKAKQAEVEKELQAVNETITKLKKMLETFNNKVREKFPQLYQNQKTIITTHMLKIINILGYNLDSLIWKRASKSESVHNAFYKPGIDRAFSAMTFLYYYIKPLDKTKLRKDDQELYEIWLNYEHNVSKKVIIVSENASLSHTLKLFMLERDKETEVREITKPVEFISYIQGNRADMVVVDSQLTAIPAHELIVKGRKVYKDENKTKFIYFVE